MNKNIYWIIGAVILLAIITNPRTNIIGFQTFGYEYNNDKDATNTKMFIGDDEFIGNNLKFTCIVNEPYMAPNPIASCWKALVKFQGKETTVPAMKDTPINNFLQVKNDPWAFVEQMETPVGLPVKFELENEWKNRFTFSIYNFDFLEIIPKETETILALNSDEKLEINIRQEMANNLPGGIYIQTSYQKLNNKVTVDEKEMTFKKGINSYTLDLDTSILGGMDIQLRPYVTIAGLDFVDDRVRSVSYNILPFITDIDTSVDCTNKACPDGFYCNNFVSSGKEYNICVKGEKPKIIPIKDIEEEPQDNDWIVAIIILSLMIGLAIIIRRRKIWAR